MKNILNILLLLLFIISCNSIDKKSYNNIFKTDEIFLDTEINYDTKINGISLYKKEVIDASYDAIGNIVKVKKTDNGQFDILTGISIDKYGNIYTVDTNNYRIQKLDKNGKFINKWGSNNLNDKSYFTSPKDIAINPAGEVYITDNNFVRKFTPEGIIITKWGGDGTSDGKFKLTAGIAIHSTGSVYVLDQLNYRIQRFDLNGKFLLKWGSKGKNKGEFIDPKGIATDKNGYVYIIDNYNNNIQKFDPNGNLLNIWEGNKFGFTSPVGIAIDNIGNIYLISKDNYIAKFDSNCKFLKKWGNKGNGNSEFFCPVDITIDFNDFVYITDSKSNTIQKFDSDGNFIVKLPYKKKKTTVPDIERKEKYSWIETSLLDSIYEKLKTRSESHNVIVNLYDSSNDQNKYILRLNIVSYDEGEYNLIRNKPSKLQLNIIGMNNNKVEFSCIKNFYVNSTSDFPSESIRIDEISKKITDYFSEIFNFKNNSEKNINNKNVDDSTSDFIIKNIQ